MDVFLFLFLGLLVCLLLLYLLNYANESFTWQKLDCCKWSDYFVSPSTFPYRQLQPFVTAPVVALHDFVSERESSELIRLAAGMLDVTNRACLTGENHQLVRVLQSRVSVLTQRKQVGPLEIIDIEQGDFTAPDPDCLTVLLFFLDQQDSCIDFLPDGPYINSQPCLGVWWYLFLPDATPSPLQVRLGCNVTGTGPKGGHQMRIQVYS